MHSRITVRLAMAAALVTACAQPAPPPPPDAAAIKTALEGELAKLGPLFQKKDAAALAVEQRRGRFGRLDDLQRGGHGSTLPPTVILVKTIIPSKCKLCGR